MTGTVVIVGMAVATVGSAVAQKILISVGKADEAQYMDLAVKSGIAGTSLSLFVKFITVLRSLG